MKRTGEQVYIYIFFLHFKRFGALYCRNKVSIVSHSLKSVFKRENSVVSVQNNAYLFSTFLVRHCSSCIKFIVMKRSKHPRCVATFMELRRLSSHYNK